MSINTNTMAISAIRMYQKNVANMQKSMKRLSSGLRINSAADDPSGLAISEKMRAQIRGLKQASDNTQDAISFIDTAEGALQQTTDILQRMRELTIKAQNTGVLSDTAKQAIDVEMTQLRDELDRIASSATFNTKHLLDGSISEESPAVFQIGPGAEDYDRISVSIGDMSSKGLSRTGDERFTISLDTPADTNTTLENIDYAINKVSMERAKLGATHNRLEYTMENLSTTEENLTAAESRIRDVDFAQEYMEYVKSSMLAQISLAMLAQANKQQEMILSLLQNM